MPRPLKLTPFKNNGFWIIRIPEKYADTGKEQRLYFKTKKEAEEKQKQLLSEISEYGASTKILPQKEAAELDSIRKLIAPYDTPLRQIVLEWIERKKNTSCKTISEITAAYLKQFDGRSKKYTTAVKSNCEKLTKQFGHTIADDLMPVAFEEWLWSTTRTPYNYAYALKGLKAIFSWAKSKKLSSTNPLESVQPKKLPNTIPKILTLEQTHTLLAACRNHKSDKTIPAHIRCDASDALLAVSILLFAGIRPKELTRLTWDDIYPSKKLIRIPADSSKTGTLRLVNIEPNLLHLITATPPHLRTGSIAPLNWERKWKAIRKASGISSEQDICRHSYASYWLAHHGDMNGLLQNMGHTTQQVTLKHYLTAAERPEAAKYWEITPTSPPSP